MAAGPRFHHPATTALTTAVRDNSKMPGGWGGAAVVGDGRYGACVNSREMNLLALSLAAQVCYCLVT